MNCKFCNEPLPEEVTLCPACGRENGEEMTQQTEAEMTEAIFENTAEENPGEATQELSEEASGEMEEELPAKPKRKLWVRILAIVCGIAILAVLAGSIYYGTDRTPKATSYTVSVAKAEKSRDTVVATVGERELTNSELQVYYRQIINDFYNYYASYMDLSTLGLDMSQPLDQQIYDATNGTTWQQYFLELALNTWQRYAALYQTGKEEGFALSEEAQMQLAGIPQQMEQMAAAYGYEDAAAMLYQDMGPACDVAGYLRFLEVNYYVGQYFEQIYARVEPTQEELDTYYAENQAAMEAMGQTADGSKLVDARHILITPQGGELDEQTGELVYSDEAWETCRQQAQDILDQWKAGEASEESFAQLATEHTQDPGSQSTGGLYTGIYEGQMVKPFEQWCFDDSRAYGDTGLVQTNYGYHIMYYVGSEPAWIANLRSQLVTERSTAFVEEAVAAYPMDVDMKKIVLCDAPTK